MATTEKELKLLLEHDSYTKILNSVKVSPTPIHQTNYYFDTHDFKLGKLGITLRVRNENSKWLLCLKIKSKAENRYVSSMEIESSITEKDFEYYRLRPQEMIKKITGEKVELDNILDLREVSLLGSIRNDRRKLNLFSEYILELDHSYFPGGNESYELEIEGVNTEDECDYIISELENLGINFSINNKSKYNRFIEFLNL